MPSLSPVAPAYSYKCVDRSPLVGPFCRYVVRWFVAWLPVGVPANFLTLASSGCMWLMLTLVMVTREVGILAPACCLFMAGYVIYDHADGMHARRTSTSGPLGEYLDHFLDVFHGPIAVVAMFIICGQEESSLLVTLIWALSLAGAAMMAEQKERGELYFGFVGPLEGMLLVWGFYAVACTSAGLAWLQAPVLGSTTRFAALMSVGVVGSLLAVVGCVRRIGRVPVEFAAFALMSAVLGWQITAAGASWWIAPLAMALHGGDYTGRTITSHLRRTPRPWPDFAAPVAAALIAVAGLPLVWSMSAIVVYLLARNLRATFQTLRAFRGYWRWWNSHLYPASPPVVAPASGSDRI